MSLRVCMIALTDYPGDTRVRREAEALVGRGDSVDVICPQTAAIGDMLTIEGVRLCPTGRLRRTRELGAAGYIRRDLSFVIRSSLVAAKLHRANPYDVVQVHTMPDFLVAAALVPKLRGAGVLLDVHDLVPELFATKFGVDESSPIVRLTRFAERRSVALADQALAVNSSHLDALVAHGNPREKFTIVMNAADPRLFARSDGQHINKTPFTLVYHGTVSRRHGLDTAIRAVAVARETYPDIRFEIVGDGDDIAELRELVQRSGLSDSISVTQGRIPVEDLRPILDRASAGIVPMTNDAFTRHTLPVKLMECVMLGLPVICSRTDTVQVYFDDEMVSYFEPGNELDLAARIVELRADGEKRRKLVERADSFLLEHSWERERERYFASIDSVAEAGRKRRGRFRRRRRTDGA